MNFWADSRYTQGLTTIATRILSSQGCCVYPRRGRRPASGNRSRNSPPSRIAMPRCSSGFSTRSRRCRSASRSASGYGTWCLREAFSRPSLFPVSGGCSWAGHRLPYHALGRVSDLRAAGSVGECRPTPTQFSVSANFSFSRQISSIRSVSTTMRCLKVTVHGSV